MVFREKHSLAAASSPTPQRSSLASSNCIPSLIRWREKAPRKIELESHVGIPVSGRTKHEQTERRRERGTTTRICRNAYFRKKPDGEALSIFAHESGKRDIRSTHCVDVGWLVGVSRRFVGRLVRERSNKRWEDSLFFSCTPRAHAVEEKVDPHKRRCGNFTKNYRAGLLAVCLQRHHPTARNFTRVSATPHRPP
jgi:hypothetical protein